MDYQSKFSENLKKAIEIANEATVEHGAVYVGSEHVVYAFLCLPKCAAYGILAGEGVTKEEYEEIFVRIIDTKNTVAGFTKRTKEMFERAMKFAIASESVTGTAHVLKAVLESDSCYAVKILRRLGADIKELREKTERILLAQKHRRGLGYGDSREGEDADEAAAGTSPSASPSPPRL